MNQDLDEEEFRSHYDASQYRSECWGELKRVTHRIERTAVRGGEAEPHRRRALELLDTLAELERYWCFPGPKEVDAVRRLVQRGSRKTLHNHVTRLLRAMVSESYRSYDPSQDEWEEDQEDVDTEPRTLPRNETRPYFEVLLVDDLTSEEAADVRRKLIGMRREDDPFVYDVVVVDNAEDAVIAVQFNHNVQACVLRYAFPAETDASRTELRYYLDHPGVADLRHTTERGRSPLLGSLQTPFFTALKEYSKQPTGVFHAMPISRGKSIAKSHWIQDMGAFYGPNIFLAETSATSGGLDSLLEPHGPIKKAQELRPAPSAPPADLLRHQRHLDLQQDRRAGAGAARRHRSGRPRLPQIAPLRHGAGGAPGVVYLDSYPLHEYSMYGAVPIREIKHQLLS
jgi:arginine decarboxylase